MKLTPVDFNPFLLEELVAQIEKDKRTKVRNTILVALAVVVLGSAMFGGVCLLLKGTRRR